MTNHIKNARVIGAGLIGTSIALALKKRMIAVEVLDLDPNAQSLAQDLIGGSVISDPDVIIICASISANKGLIIEALNRNPRSIVIDVSSVKSNLLLDIKELSDNAHNFVASHPMAGREVSGAQSARSDLFVGRAWIGIESKLSSPHAKEVLKELVALCEASLYWLSSEDHDQTVAAISHMPQLVSTALAHSLQESDAEVFNLSGQGLRDVLRLAGSNPKLWSELLISNKDSLNKYLSNFIKSVQMIKESIESNDERELSKIFGVGNKVFSEIPGKHGGKKRDYLLLPIVIEDKPGQLAKIFDECAAAGVNIEDLSIEHSPGQLTGLITLAVNEFDAQPLSNHLRSNGWNVHPIISR